MRWTRFVPFVLSLSVAVGVALAAVQLSASEQLDEPFDVTRLESHTRYSGGDLTVFDETSNAFGLPAPNLPPRELRKFTFGNKMFDTHWIMAPASNAHLDGLGPFFNRASCMVCHLRDGRGQPPAGPDNRFTTTLVRLSIPGEDEYGGPLPHPNYGTQMNDGSILGVQYEGTPRITWVEVEGQYPDGTPYTLRKPDLKFVELFYGPLESEGGPPVLTSVRVTPAVFGLGLLDAVAEEDILALADPDDADGDGISGRPNYPWDVEAGEHRLGRFGWKANEPSVRQQSAGAALGDIGLTSSIFPVENAMPNQHDALAAISGADPGTGVELSDFQLERMVFYIRSLSVPARRDLDDPQVQRGEQLFHEIGCATCHTPTMRTPEVADMPILSNQTFHPYTDLLLHDMGEGLADGRPDFDASGSEWRTAPLWGLGMYETVNGHTLLLHDGRARGPEEAILWHGGEAEQVRDRFKQLPTEDRDALVRFLLSL